MKSKFALLLIVIFLSCSYDVSYSGGETDIDDAVSRRAIEVELQARWDEIRAALIRDDIERVLTYFVAGSRERYRKEFTTPGSRIKTIFLEIKELKLYTVDERVAQCGAIRIENGKTFSYPIVFVRDENGVWKIMGF